MLNSGTIWRSLMLSLAMPVLLWGQATQPTGGQADLRVEAVDLRNERGHLRIGVFREPEGFPEEREEAILWRSVPADAQSAATTLQLPPGRYAVVVLHDENSNRKLDRNFLGIPKEGYGVTNNPKPALRAARFEEAVLELPPEGKSVQISLQYF